MGRTQESITATKPEAINNEGPTNVLVARLEMVPPTLGWIIGLLVMAWPTFSTGFAKVQGGLGDSRLVNFSLEHSYRWLMGMPLAGELWSPPIFFPVRGIATYTDLMLGAAPFYWPWRWLGCDPHTAYQLWMLVIWSLNFLSCYLLLRRGIRISTIGSSMGAFLFAFGGPRYMSMAHQQLAPQFWLILSLAGLIMIFSHPSRRSPTRSWIASGAFWGGLVAQLYTAVYPLAFFCLGLAAAAIFALAVSTLRKAAVAALKTQIVSVLVIGVIAVAMAAPITVRYRATSKIVGMHGRASIHLPKPLSWVLPGNSNRAYGKIQRSWELAEYRGFSQTNGVGAITLALCLAGLWLGRRRPEVQLMVAGYASLMLLTTSLPGGSSLWWIVREVVPGSAALRAVARVGLMGLFPAAVGLALVFERLSIRKRWILAAAAFLVVAAEQPHRRPSFDKAAVNERVAQIAAKVPADAQTFLLVINGHRWDKYLHDDAAWVALSAGVPTVNGRYGHFPPEYPFRNPQIERPDDRVELRKNLNLWIEGIADESKAASLIEIAPRPERKRARK